MIRPSQHESFHLHGILTPTIRTGPGLSAGPAWMRDPGFPCSGDNAYLFFPHDGTTEEIRAVNRINQSVAKAICEGCPFRIKCATQALDEDERHGVWGGHSMSSAEDRRRAIAETGWTPKTKPKAPTQRELIADRVAAAEAERERVENVVRSMWEDGKSDGAIAAHLGKAPGTINKIRKNLGLATLHGPRGRRLDLELAR